MSIGKRLKELRGNLTQDDLAKEIGVTKNTISRWEKNSKSMSARHAVMIAKVLGCHVLDIISEENGSESPCENDNKPVEVLIGERIKYQRGSLPQRELARELNVHVNSIGKWERGETDLDLKSAIRLCVFFGISLDWLAFGDTRENTSEEKREPVAILIHLDGVRLNEFRDGEEYKVGMEVISRASNK